MASKMCSVRILLLTVAFARPYGLLRAQSPPRLDDAAIEQRVSRMLGQMTLEEKIGQTVHFADSSTGPGSPHADYREQAAQGRVGSFENITGAAETNSLQKLAVENSRLHIPLVFALDVIHGYRTIFPVPLAMASTWDPALVERASRIAAKEATKEGIRWTYSPMVDIARDARWGRIVEGAGEDPYLGSAMAIAYVRGYQGARLDDPESMLACIKHFVGYGAAEAGRDYNSVDMSDRMLRQVYLPPFHAAVEAGGASVMSAFNTLNGVPATSNRFTLTHILREEWGFEGVVISDYGSVRESIAHGIAVDGKTAASKAILAGVDVDLESNEYSRYLAELVRSGEVPEAAVDQAARRMLRIKFALGLFDHPYIPEPASGARPQPDPADVEFARTVAERSFVLLKNDSSGGKALLPFGPDVHTIALIGPLADDASDMLGPWRARGDAADVVTLRTALASRMQQLSGRVLYAKGTEILTAKDNGFAEAVAAARQADVVFMALGEDSLWMTAEAASRAHLGLPGNQQQLLEAVAAAGKPVVLIVFSGRPLTLNWAATHVPAILQAWFPGVQAGPALVRTLFGDVSPSGKLTVSMPRSVGQQPLYYDALNTGRPADGVDLSRPPANNHEKYHSRYVDEENAALFPFGYGLSYTQFTYSPLELGTSRLSASALNEKAAQPLHVSATVRNAGSRAGDEIVELYVRLRGTSVALPVRQLEGFRRLTLSPGQSQRVEFTLGRDELAFWNIDMQNLVEPAHATVWIGPNSAEGESADFVIEK
ncbi:MAG TPA: glycoside hydrolase family 3 N-terminal domain-containing protein [Verrucomicrobiae bacterium]|nr:glycoside hydrolase family 3 N-terminal domain-containing protein [Verrucomicrobiae bacterium]